MFPATVERAIMDTGQRTLLYDGFQRANSNSGLGTAPTGQAWVAVSGVAGINNQVAVPITYSAGFLLVNINCGRKDYIYRLAFSFGTTTSGKTIRQAFRVVDGANQWFVYFSDTSVAIYERVANVNTLRASLGTTLSSSTVYSCTVIVVGVVVSVFLSTGASVSYSGMATFLTSTLIGAWFTNSGPISGEQFTNVLVRSL